MKKLSIIILTYNTQDLTLNCLRSLSQQNLNLKNSDFEVILVDNNSHDGTLAAVKKSYPWVKILKNSENLGFAAGNNPAIKKAKGEIVLLLNSDTLVPDATLQAMLDFLRENPDVGAATPRIELADGSLDLACHRGFPTPWNAFTYFLGLERLFPNSKICSGYHQTYQNFNLPHEVDAISGACFFIRSKVIDQVGLLDERFFMYAEDLDWCLRIKEAGWRIMYNPQVKIIHLKKQSGRKKKSTLQGIKEAKRLRKKTTDHFFFTMQQFYDKHYQNRYPKALRFLVLAGIFIFQKLKSIRK